MTSAYVVMTAGAKANGAWLAWIGSAAGPQHGGSWSPGNAGYVPSPDVRGVLDEKNPATRRKPHNARPLRARHQGMSG
jgi:hypothetical protein